jgi:hypothetical protein
MSGIVLSASVRQNLLSLQSTAELLATTQNRLSTGKKVNTALDNPTNFFTAAALDSRASDINNLLDGISNGTQVLQAANTGITSLQRLVDSAKSVANQALQTNVGYSTKSNVTTAAITGATAEDLRGTTAAATNAVFTGAAATGNTLTAYTNATVTGSTTLNDNTSGATNITGATALSGTAGAGSNNLASNITTGDTLVVNGTTITFVASGATGNQLNVTDNITALLAKIDSITGATVPSSVASGQLTLSTGTAANLVISGSALAKLGLSAGTTNRGGGSATTTPLVGTTLLSGTASPSNSVLSTAFTAGNTLTVNGATLTFVASGATGANQINVTDNVTTLLSKIDGLSGGTGSTVTGGQIVLNTGTTSDLTITSNNNAALTALGLGTGVTQARTPGVSPLSGLTLTIGATGGGTATSITFGDGTGGTIKTLNQLNASLAANNLQATLDTTGRINITTSNEAASSTIGAIGGTAAGAGRAFNGLTAGAPIADAASQTARANLVAQYNNILAQITTTAQDASFNGVNLLNGDQLKLVFNETGKSTLNITGVTFNPAGLGLANLAVGTDFIDNGATNKVLTSLNAASTALRAQASSLGSNLSIVQIRQDFSKQLINVLQTGSSSLTLADTNEEAANSQALSTRQSIAVSALALANQSQQSVLQLLR